MIQETLNEMLIDIWPMLVIVLVICITFRIAYIIKNKKKVSLYKELLSLILIIYIICLFHIVTFQDINFGKSNFIPFKEMFRYEILSQKFIKNVIGNVCLFIPYGFFVSYYLKSKKAIYPIILTIIASLTIETVQYNIGRVFDVDDIILNIIGGFLGYLIYIIIETVKSKIPRIFKNDTFLNCLIILILVLVVLYMYNLKIFNFGW